MPRQYIIYDSLISYRPATVIHLSQGKLEKVTPEIKKILDGAIIRFGEHCFQKLDKITFMKYGGIGEDIKELGMVFQD